MPTSRNTQCQMSCLCANYCAQARRFLIFIIITLTTLPGQQTAKAGLVPCKDCIISQQDTVAFNSTHTISILHSYKTEFVQARVQSSYNPLLQASSIQLLDPIGFPSEVLGSASIYTTFVPHYIGYVVQHQQLGVNRTARKSWMLWLSIELITRLQVYIYRY